MKKRTWLPSNPKPKAKPKLPDAVRADVDAKVTPLLKRLKKRIGKKPVSVTFNWPDGVFTRWHRDALYFVIVMRTPRGRPETFETHAARITPLSGKFELAMPMRRGWMTVRTAATLNDCLKALEQEIWI